MPIYVLICTYPTYLRYFLALFFSVVGIQASLLNTCFLLTQIAITGKGFFKASEMATELIISNILRIGKVNVIGDVILFLGKLCVSLSSAVFAFLMLNTHKYNSAHNKISSPLFPVLVRFLVFKFSSKQIKVGLSMDPIWIGSTVIQSKSEPDLYGSNPNPNPNPIYMDIQSKNPIRFFFFF